MRTIAFTNQKGGTGKTTACVSVGAGLVRAGQRVLLIDLDSQGNATVSVGIRPAADQPTTAEFLQGQVRIEDVMVDSYLADLSVIPATPDLAHLEVVLAGKPKSQFSLRKALEQSRDTVSAFDYVLIDCPPSLSLLTVNGLSAAQYAVVPVLCDYLSLEGLAHLTDTISQIRTHLNPSLDILGILPNLVDHRLRITEESIALLRRQFGSRVFRTEIRTCSRLREAPSFGKAIFDYAPGSTAAENFAALVREIQRRVR